MHSLHYEWTPELPSPVAFLINIATNTHTSPGAGVLELSTVPSKGPSAGPLTLLENDILPS